MPLTVSRRAQTGTLWITGTVRPAGAPRGVRVRRRAGTDDPCLAAEEAAALEAAILRAAWHGDRPAARSWADAVLSYLQFETRSAGTQALLHRITQTLGDVMLPVTQEQLDGLRALMLRPGARPGTVRRNILVPVSAVLTHAAKRGWCDVPRFEAPAIPPGRTAYLTPEQARGFLAAAAAHRLRAVRGMRLPILILLTTGLRLGELLALDWTDIDLAGKRLIVWEDASKTGRRRVVELCPALVVALDAEWNRIGAVVLNRSGRPYRQQTTTSPGGNQLRGSWRSARLAAGLPATITPHVLRHTWATWHYALHRDLLRLRYDGGWSTASQVERYAHLMPSGHEREILALRGEIDAESWHVADTASDAA